MDYDTLINGNQPTETGFLEYITGAVDTVDSFGQTLSGERLKLARAATAQKELDLKIAEQQALATIAAAQAGALQAPQAPGVLSHRIFGIPTVALVGVAAVAAFFLLRK